MLSEIIGISGLLHSQESLFYGLNHGLDSLRIFTVAFEVKSLKLFDTGTLRDNELNS